MRPVLSFAVLIVLAAPALAQPKLPNLPPDLMAPTDPLAPADERKAFTVPDGFDVQLVASEPDIQKPIQMAFDAKGRLWVTTSYHYPFAAQGKATDKLFVLSDFDPVTGKANKVQTFADDLNIPIGILPLPDCNSCIVSSVGEIRKYTDTKGTGRADKMEVLYKGFGTRDTHGMYNSFTLMPDGWVYACHGFSNDSTVKGKDGHEVKMNSGNTFRFKPDGSRIEVWTRGQVNPFGIAIDPWFNLYTADCHSKPITQLIPGAYYDSFGKPHDGLGYGPHVTHHDHGSTALCGLTWYDADHFPKEYKGTMFLGNVVTNRINFDAITWKGATPVAKEQPDFLVSKDRWFRPVDIKLGPDGALYVADFYNKIIGHYEVDLKDPRRDKDRGRVWRIVWKGRDGTAPKPAYTDLTKEKPDDLAKLLASPNMAVRMMATQECLRRDLSEELSKAITGVAMKQASVAAPYCLWILERKGEFKTPVNMLVLGYVAIKGRAAEISLPHNMFRPLIGRDRLTDDFRKHVLDMTKQWWEDEKNFQKPASDVPNLLSLTARVFTELVTRHPHADFVKPLIEILKKCPADDTHLRMSAKIALRNCLRDADAWPQGDDAVFVEMAIAIPSRKAAEYLVSRLKAKTLPADKLNVAVEHAARYGAVADDEYLFGWLSSQQNSDALAAGIRGMQAKGARLDKAQTERLIQRGVSDCFAEGFLGSKPEPADVKLVSWGLRTLKALPAAGDRESLKLGAGHVEGLANLAGRPKAPAEIRIGVVEVLLVYAPVDGLKAVRKQLADATTPDAVRDGVLLAAAASNLPGVQAEARDGLKTVPYRVAVPIGLALAGTKDGADLLLIAIKEGKAPPRLLQEKAILERLKGSDAPDWQKRVADLTKNLPPADQRLAALIKTRADGFAKAKPDKVEGAKLFTKHCAACHRIGDVGGKIAPQLDGVGVRGAERLLEDVLDPNRNVDQAFRARSITLTNEKTLTALMLRVEGEVLVVADLEGKEQRIPLKEIAVNRETMLSAMPANFGDVVPEVDMYNIIAYLLDQKAKDPPKK